MIYGEGDRFVGRFPPVSGAWRFAVDFLLNSYDYPFRWGWSGTLAPGAQVTIHGKVKIEIPFTTIWWGGLVQEGSGSWKATNVGKTMITVGGQVPGEYDDTEIKARISAVETAYQEQFASIIALQARLDNLVNNLHEV